MANLTTVPEVEDTKGYRNGSDAILETAYNVLDDIRQYSDREAAYYAVAQMLDDLAEMFRDEAKEGDEEEEEASE